MTDTEDVQVHDRPAPPLPPPPEAAPAPRAPAGHEKAPALAVVLSFFMPGLGHLYAEAYERAAMIFAGFILIIFATANGAFPVPLCVLACVFLWFFGMFDSYREVQIINLGGAAPEPVPRKRGEGRLLFGVFLAVVGGLLLVENLELFDLDWLLEWWPALVVAVGIYLVVASVRERGNRGSAAGDGTDYSAD